MVDRSNRPLGCGHGAHRTHAADAHARSGSGRTVVDDADPSESGERFHRDAGTNSDGDS